MASQNKVQGVGNRNAGAGPQGRPRSTPMPTGPKPDGSQLGNGPATTGGAGLEGHHAWPSLAVVAPPRMRPSPQAKPEGGFLFPDKPIID